MYHAQNVAGIAQHSGGYIFEKRSDSPHIDINVIYQPVSL